jgi:integrase
MTRSSTCESSLKRWWLPNDIVQATRTLRRGDGYVQERARKNGSIAYIARWFDGLKWRGQTFSTYDEAEDHLRDIGRSKRRGDYTPESDITVSMMVDDYLRRRASEWSPNTQGVYRHVANLIIAPRLGKRRLRDLTPRLMQVFVDELGQQYRPRRVDLVRAVLSGAFREAVRLGLMSRNPLEGVRAARRPGLPRRTWGADEAGRMLDAHTNDPEQYAWYMLAFSTGMRPGELRALQWGDVDEQRRLITIARTATRDAESRNMMGTTTKTGRSRAVAISDDVVTALHRYRPVLASRRLKASYWVDLDLIFPRFDGNLVSQQTIAVRHRKACETAGVPYITPHGVRHTAATLLIEAGVDVKTVSEMLGHASVKTTLDIYVRVTGEMQRRAADTMSEILRRRA